MKITSVEHFLTSDVRSSAVFLKIETDAGIAGYGEATNHFLPHTSLGALQDLTPYLIGEDPERIAYLWQACYRRRFYRGGPATGAALSFELPLGPKPLTGWQAEAIIEVAAEGTERGAPALSVNALACALRNTQELKNGNRLLTYSIPTNLLPGQSSDTVAITAAADGPINVLRVEVRIAPTE